MSRYADPFLNALMDSHQIMVNAEIWYDDALIGSIKQISGSVSADRGSSVRRTATVTVDPTALKDPALGPYLNPYGTQIKLSRGVRYPDGGAGLVNVFTGRIDAIDLSLDGIVLHCSDLAADIVDSRFPDDGMNPSRLPGPPTTIFDTIQQLIWDVKPGAPFSTGNITAEGRTQPLSGTTSWSQERSDALDSLCTQLQSGCEWYVDMDGVWHIEPLPAGITLDTPIAWIIDSGDRGVLVERTITKDRSTVYNAVRVVSEPVGGTQPAYGWAEYHDPVDANGGMSYGGPFGKVVGFYTGQHVNSTDAANKLADSLMRNSLSSIDSLSVSCVPNPKLRLGQVVRVFADIYGYAVDGMYYVQSMTMPLDPESAMELTLNTTYDTNTRTAPTLRIPEGATWAPARSSRSTSSTR